MMKPWEVESMSGNVHWDHPILVVVIAAGEKENQTVLILIRLIFILFLSKTCAHKSFARLIFVVILVASTK